MRSNATPIPSSPSISVERDLDPIVEIAHADLTPLFHDDAGLTSSNATSLAGPEAPPDPAAVFSVLQFGCVIPPTSPWPGVHRFMPGHRYAGTTRIGPIAFERLPHLASLDLEQQADLVEHVLDETISQAIGDGPDPVVLFSGGVDSGLIASRLAALGRRDSILFNFSFDGGGGDPESKLAEAMAKHLGLRFERISETRDLCDCLITPGQVFAQPFADHSTVPATDFAHSIIEQTAGEGRVILDGEGAESGFGVTGKIRKWQLALCVPGFVYRPLSIAYTTGLWTRASLLENYAALFRRAETMSLISAISAENSLAGVLYEDDSAAFIHQAFAQLGDGKADRSMAQRLAAQGMTFFDPGLYAQKAHQVYTDAGLEVHYPFMSPKIGAIAQATVDHWQNDEPKAVLKRSLARHVPREMVYRPKSGFTDPRARIFGDPQFIEHLRAAAEPGGPISSMLVARNVVKACDLLARGVKLPALTLPCLWAIAFTDRWYRTAR